MTNYVIEVLREKWIVIEWRGDAIYKTRNTGEMIWVPIDTNPTDKNEQWVVPSTSFEGQTIRRRNIND